MPDKSLLGKYVWADFHGYAEWYEVETNGCGVIFSHQEDALTAKEVDNSDPNDIEILASFDDDYFSAWIPVRFLRKVE